MSEIIEETQEFRVRIEHDDDPSEPYDDGGSPILRYSFVGWRGWDVDQVTSITSHKVDDSIIKAFSEVMYRDGRHEIFERYMRIFHGTRSVVWRDSPHRGDDYSYVTFDTADWREEVGLTDEWLGEVTEGRAEPLELADMTEYEAYLRGEAYGWVIEKKTHWIRVDKTGTPIFLSGETYREDWEEVESCWGYYDREYVESEAREALEALIEEE